MLCSCSYSNEDSPKNGLSTKGPLRFDSTLVWDISSISTTREERISFLLNQDSAFRHRREGYPYDGRFAVHHSGVLIKDTLWYENGEKDSLLKKMKKLSVNFPNTRFFVLSFKVKEDGVSWKKEPGYSLWFKQL
ncbi:MAG: hypothetical protein WCO58_03155 [bacterium]